jgi:hypothetical protein
MGLLQWIENAPISAWVRESVSLFAYPGILSAHTIGLAFVVGVSVAISLRALGFAPAVPLAPMRGFLPALWAGFWINAISGSLLLASSATKLLVNPIFLVKMTFVTLAVVCVFFLNRELFGHRGAPAASVSSTPTSRARLLAFGCLGLWSGAIITGRLTAYLDLVKNLFFGPAGSS